MIEVEVTNNDNDAFRRDRGLGRGVVLRLDEAQFLSKAQRVAEGPAITLEDVEISLPLYQSKLASSFFRVRLDRGKVWTGFGRSGLAGLARQAVTASFGRSRTASQIVCGPVVSPAWGTLCRPAARAVAGSRPPRRPAADGCGGGQR